MKTHPLYLLALAGGVVFCLAAPGPISGQNAVSSPAIVIEAKGEASPEVLALIDQLALQNKKLVANQAAMDERIAEIAESVRQARIFVSRSGRGGK